MESPEYDRIECLTECQCSFRAAGLGGASKQQSGGYQIAMVGEILATLDEGGDLVGVEYSETADRLW
jgi:hypothetical protein